MAKYKIYLTTNGQKEKVDETNSLKDFWYIWREYNLAYGSIAKNLSHNIKEPEY